jgi:hypothetical protein
MVMSRKNVKKYTEPNEKIIGPRNEGPVDSVGIESIKDFSTCKPSRVI